MERSKAAWPVRALLITGLLGSPFFAWGQRIPEQTVEIDGQTLHFELRTFPPNANTFDASAVLEPISALDTAKLLHRFLTAGKIEDAAMLSNAPRRRFEVFLDYQTSVGEDGFKGVFTEYFDPSNRVVAEIVMGSHSLLIWRLGERTRYAGQYYVEVEGKVLLDDVPNETRARLRRVLEAVRAGKLALPSL